MRRLFLLFFLPLLAGATEPRPWNWPTEGFQAVLSIGADLIPGTVVTQGRPMAFAPLLAQFEEGKDGAYDLRYTIVVSREGETLFQELNQHCTGKRDTRLPRKFGAFGACPVAKWEVPLATAPGLYHVMLLARDMIGGKLLQRNYEITVKKREY